MSGKFVNVDWMEQLFRRVLFREIDMHSAGRALALHLQQGDESRTRGVRVMRVPQPTPRRPRRS
jgi:hypothetical protein